MRAPARKRTAALVAAISLVAMYGTAARAQTPPALHADSGINSADTYVTADITIHNQATLTLSQPVHDNGANADTSSMQVGGPDTHYHIEAGYDTSNHLVFDMYPTDPAVDSTTNLTDSISKIQYVNGQATVYDLSGSPITAALPQDPKNPTAASSAPQPGAWLGAMPGPTVLHYLVTSDPASIATETGGTLQTSTANGQTVDQVTVASHLSGGGTTIWTYQSGSSGWIMQQATVTRSMSQLQMTSSTLYANVAWVQNAAGDNARRTLTSTALTPPGASSYAPPTAALATADGTQPQAAVQSFANGAQNVVFQHGFLSSGKTWNRMTGWLNPLFEFGGETVPSLPSTDRLASQGTDLVNLLSGAQNDSILIGHSQGGLISRDVAQRRPDLAAGVLTMDTPHQGVLLDLTGRAALAGGLALGINSLASLAGCTSPSDNAACALAFFLAVASFPVVNFALDSALPATTDLQPFGLSPYINNLNSQPENFVRVGIEGHSDKRWLLERLGGDSQSNPDDTFGGRNTARATAAIFGAFITCAIIATLEGDFDTAAICLGIALIMKAIDVFWNTVTSGTDASDGIVQGSSQHYPNATASYVISGADSHVGVTRSDKTRDRAIDALDRQFFVPRTGCSFLLSPASASVGGGGSSGSFAINTAVNTPSACSWSAVSDVPWITVPAGTHGVGNGTISYTVAANPSTTASRSGTVTVSGLHFTVTQTPFPDFQLSITPSSQTVAASGSTGYTVSASALNGFNGPVTLSAAVSPGGPTTSLSAGSIQVGAGGSGTSTLTLSTTTATTPGSYAVTITGTGSGLTRSAAVALDVNPPPSPARGTITINGAFSLQCQQDGTCPAAGSISVQIGGALQGNTYYVTGGTVESIPVDPFGFNGASDNQGLANEIAGAFNFSGSPVSANVTQGGPGTWYVNFVTAQTGSNTNYPVEIIVPGAFAPLLFTVTPPGSGPGGTDPDGTTHQVGFLGGGR
jgi:pimeloyl-ACP methyl ester carboxylesterase